MIPKNWSFTPLSEILERVRKPVSVEHNAIYKEIGIRSHGKGIFYKEATTGEALGNKSVFWIEPDCFILNIVFAWEQAIAVTTMNEQGMIASHRFPMYKPKRDFLLLDYLLYFFMTPRGKYLLELASPGGAGRNKTLGQAEFLKLEILLPPLPEQRKIVEILSTWDKAIALLEQLIIAKRKLKQGLMQQLLTGKKRFKEFISSSEVQKTDCGNLPTDWDIKPLEEVAHKIMVGIASAATHAYRKSGIVMLRNMNIKENYIDESDLLFIDPEYELKHKGKRLKMGDVITVRTGYPGLSAVVTEKFNGAQCFTSLITRPNTSVIHSQFLCMYINSEYGMKFMSTSEIGGAQKNVNAGSLSKMPVPLPSIKEQERIINFLSLVNSEIFTLEKQLAAYKQQKRGLMQQLLTGKKRVKIDEPQMQRV